MHNSIFFTTFWSSVLQSSFAFLCSFITPPERQPIPKFISRSLKFSFEFRGFDKGFYNIVSYWIQYGIKWFNINILKHFGVVDAEKNWHSILEKWGEKRQKKSFLLSNHSHCMQKTILSVHTKRWMKVWITEITDAHSWTCVFLFCLSA